MVDIQYDFGPQGRRELTNAVVGSPTWEILRRWAEGEDFGFTLAATGNGVVTAHRSRDLQAITFHQ